MGKTDKRVDDYMAKSQDFAKPILIHLRKLVHKACPGVEETIKWGFPNFVYNGVMCSMASFKEHAAFNFWKASLLADPKKILFKKGETSMGDLGRIKSLSDLPSDKIMLEYLKEAAKLNKSGVKVQRKKVSKEKKELVVPDYLTSALNKNKNALTTFETFSYTNKKDYVEWITEAKTEETRNSRLKTAVEWMAEGKVRNWKYIKK
jgi:uncharacterized protein YdeI (YjbR/CyaY-like superfamily)